jgi:membrane associated rhomboid family serine protease
MLDDRHYMRSDGRPGGSWGRQMSLTIVLIISLIVVFAFQQINAVYLRFPLLEYFALSNWGLSHGYVWQLLTFQFLHAGKMHIFCNLIGLWFFGKYIEERLGKFNLLKLYFLSGVVGGLLQSLLAWIFPYHFGVVPTVGASAGVFGLVAAFATLEPGAEILMFFFLPMRAISLLYIEGGIALFFTIVPSDPAVAHAAHLGGTLFGVAYVRWGLTSSRNWSEWNPLRRKLRREQMIRAATISPAKLRRRPKLFDTQDLPSEEFISQQVDPILDKISAHGIQSLTDRERQILQAARAKMAKR